MGLYPIRPSYIPFQTDPFYKEKKSVGKVFGIQGHSSSGKQLQHSFLCVLGGGLHLCPGWWASHPGAQWLRYHGDCLQSSWDTKVDLLMVSWSQGESYVQFLKQ